MNVQFLRKLVFIMFLILLAIILLTKCTSGKNYTKNTKTIIDSKEYSKITTEELKNKLGEPTSAEPWKLNNEKGSFNVSTYSYDLDAYYLDFIVSDDTNRVIKMYYMPNKPKQYKDIKNKADILKMLGLENIKMQVVIDTGDTLRLKTEDPNIVKVDIYGLDEDKKTFDTVYVSMDSNYF